MKSPLLFLRIQRKEAFLPPRECESLSHVWLFAIPWTVQSMEFSRPEYWSGYPFPSPGDLPNPRIKARSSTSRADSLPAEPQGKSENTGMGSLSLHQWICLTQELNRGLLHCRRILYQLSYQGSPVNPCAPSLTIIKLIIAYFIFYEKVFLFY